MGALGLMVLFVGCLATGATRQKVYRASSARVGGRISCAVVGVFSYLVVELTLIILYKIFDMFSFFPVHVNYICSSVGLVGRVCISCHCYCLLYNILGVVFL